MRQELEYPAIDDVFDCDKECPAALVFGKLQGLPTDTVSLLQEQAMILKPQRLNEPQTSDP